MAKGFFITATDTGVGKSVVAGALIRGLKAEGRSVCAMKPVESGCLREGGELIPADGTFLREVSGVSEPVEQITPCRLEHPLAPMVAAEMENRKIDVAGLEGEIERLAERYEVLLVEGIGGLLVPITPDYSVLDMARAAGFPLVVVASPALGTINHTLLTVHHALGGGLAVAGVIINYSRPPENTLAERTNPGAIRQLCPVPLLGVMPFLPDVANDTLEDAARDNLDMGLLIDYLE